MNDKITTDDLGPLLKSEFEAADNYYQQLRVMQAQAFAYYEGQPFGDEMQGRSKVVLPDVQEAIDYMKQSVLRTFMSGDRTVEFEAVDEDQDDNADDATSAIDYNFMRKQDGKRVLDDVVTDGLLKKYGIFKVGVDEKKQVTRHWVDVPTDDELGLIPEELIENIREVEQGFRVLIKQEKSEKNYCINALPTHELRFSVDARHEDEATYISHVRVVTRSDLVEMGFDAEQAYELSAYTDDLENNSESNDLDHTVNEESSKALETVRLHEEYALIDLDGDGIAERVKCFRVDDEILKWADGGEEAVETVEDQPFAIFCPFPRPHRLVGYSLADKVMDLQLVRSYVARQLFDGLANTNMPRMEIPDTAVGDNTLADILNPIPGSPVRTKAPGQLRLLNNSFDVGKSLQVMEWATGERESRTGITRMNQGLDADTLNKTATGTALMQAQGQQFEEYVARNLAEAFSRAFGKLYRIMRIEADPFNIRVDGKPKKVDPSQWPEGVNIRIRVGLGSGSKDKRIQARMALLEPLQVMTQEGLSGPKHAFNMFDGLLRDLDIGQGEDIMFDPSDPEVQRRMQQQEDAPNPEMKKVAAEMQMKQLGQQAQMQLDTAKAEADATLDREKAEAGIQTEREKHTMQMEASRERARLEIDLAREKAQAEIDLAQMKMAAEVALQEQGLEDVITDQHMGGSIAT